MADADGNVWVSDRTPTVTWILHPAAGTGTAAVTSETKDIGIRGAGAGAEAVGAGYLWVIAGPLAFPRANNLVSLIDVRSHRLVSSIPLHGETTAIAFGYGSAWIERLGAARHRRRCGQHLGAHSAGTLIRVDPETQRVLARRSVAARYPALLAIGAGFLWTANLADFSLSQISQRTGKTVRTIPIGSYTSIPCGLAATRNAVWVAVGDAYCDTANR